MRRHLSSLLLACCALALLAACGSSGSSTATTTRTGSATTGSSSSSGAGSGAGASGKGSTPASSPRAGIKVDTTPKFASPSPNAPVQSGLVQIAYRNIAIAPDTVRVKVGSTVKWTNYDSTQANVTSEGGPMKFASKNFGKGGTYELKVTKPGTIHYESTLYPVTMNGTIEVVA